jgi:biopolymer transport protein TolR
MRTAPARIRAEPNVTPMIDVMLVLLIIFMAVGPLLGAGFPVVPPQGTHLSAHPDEAADAVIGLDAAGRYYFNKQRVTEETLGARLAERFQAHAEDRVVYVRADKGLTYDRVQAAMELAAGAGARVVGLVSEQPPRTTRRDLAIP